MEKKAVGKGMKRQKQAYLFLAPVPDYPDDIRFCAACRCDCDQHHEYQYLHE